MKTKNYSSGRKQKPAAPETNKLSYAKALLVAANFCKNKQLPNYLFSCEDREGIILYNLAHPENKRINSTDKRIHCASGVPDIWVGVGGKIIKQVA